MAEVWYQSSASGASVVTHVSYSHRESRGPLALAVTAGLSLLSVTAMLLAILITGFKTKHQFARSQVGAYFISLALSDFLQAVGSLMNARWVIIEGVSTGKFCTIQAALKQTGNVGTALWSLVLATHTFSLLFLRRRTSTRIFHGVLFGVWMLIAFVIMMGPVLLQDKSRGPFWGISGYWCWITDAYHIEQLTDEYLFMFLTATVSIVLYPLIFLKLRGNLDGSGWDLRFHRVKKPWEGTDGDDSQMSIVGKQMLWYPVAYTIIIVPIAACRWSAIFGHTVPYGATMTADTIFMLSGFVNAILYSTTRKIISISALISYCRLTHTVSSTGRKDRSPRTASLDDIQFSIPAVPNGVVSFLSDITRSPHGGHCDIWKAKGGDEMSARSSYPSFTDSKHTLWKTNSEVTSLDGVPGEAHMVPNRSVLVPWRGHYHTATCHPVSEQLRTGHWNASDSSFLALEDTPPLRHKRLSDMGFPSLEEDVHVHVGELEQMRFAAPSPETVSKKPPPDNLKH